MEFDIISRETIKPSSPTPHHLRNFKLSFLDVITPEMYTPLVLFYPVNDHTKAAKRSHLLKTSLSKILTSFYPLAGRIKDPTSIECTDDGADYIEARVNCGLSDILEKPDSRITREFLPIEVESKEAVKGCLLLVQATFFQCGGMAIGICISHKLTDASTLSMFINSWAAMALDPHDESNGLSFLINPQFLGATLFPLKDLFVPHPMKLVPDKCVTRRYVFDASSITALKAKAASTSVPQPTRVEVVTALIWKNLMNASKSIRGYQRLSLLTHTVNLRKRTIPPLSETIVGNISGIFAARWEETETDLQGLVHKLRRGIQELSEKTIKNDMGEETYKTILKLTNLVMAKRGEIDMYTFSSWCRFPLYEADFGWGKPVWVSPGGWTFSNTVFLMDTREGDGLEVLVTLGEEDMALIEHNEELLAFACLNPSVIVY